MDGISDVTTETTAAHVSMVHSANGEQATICDCRGRQRQRSHYMCLSWSRISLEEAGMDHHSLTVKNVAMAAIANDGGLDAFSVTVSRAQH